MFIGWIGTKIPFGSVNLRKVLKKEYISFSKIFEQLLWYYVYPLPPIVCSCCCVCSINLLHLLHLYFQILKFSHISIQVILHFFVLSYNVYFNPIYYVLFLLSCFHLVNYFIFSIFVFLFSDGRLLKGIETPFFNSKKKFNTSDWVMFS